MGFEWLPTGPCPVLPTTRPLHGSGPMKIERQLNQRINSINLEPIRWYFRIVQYLLLRTEPGSGDRDRNAYATATSA